MTKQLKKIVELLREDMCKIMRDLLKNDNNQQCIYIAESGSLKIQMIVKRPLLSKILIGVPKKSWIFKVVMHISGKIKYAHGKFKKVNETASFERSFNLETAGTFA